MLSSKEMLETTPLSLFIADTLQQEIESGVYCAEAMLPSESSLTKRFKTNRYTIRKSLHRLVQIGLILPQKGVGYFVNKKPLDIRYAVTSVTRYSKIIEALGCTPKANLIFQEKMIPPESIAQALHLGSSEEVYKLDILRYADDIPITWSETFLPAYLFPGFLNKTEPFTSLYSILEQKYDVLPQRMHSTFQAIIPTVREAAYLQISEGTPLIQIESTVCDQKKRPIEVTFAKYRGDICRVSVDF